MIVHVESKSEIFLSQFRKGMKNVILIDTDNFIKKHFITKEKSDLSRPKKSLPPLACSKKFPRRLACNKQEKFRLRRLKARGVECCSPVHPPPPPPPPSVHWLFTRPLSYQTNEQSTSRLSCWKYQILFRVLSNSPAGLIYWNSNFTSLSDVPYLVPDQYCLYIVY